MEANTFSHWRKSSRSGGGDNCVEVAFTADDTVGMRDSKNPSGPVLRFDRSAWRAFVDGVRDGQFDI